jgi:type I restriction enzyme S subunit
MTNSKTKTIPKGWELKKISDLLDYERPDNYIVKSVAYDNDNKTPVLTANKSFILGYTDEDFGIYKDTPVIIFDDFTTDSKFVDFPFKVKSSAIKILKPKNNEINLKFVFEKMKSIKFPVGNHKRYYISQYQDMNIVVPKGKNEQDKIAEILFKVDEDIDRTEEIIKKTEKLKKGLMQELFSEKLKVKSQKLGNLASNIYSGGTPSRSKMEYYRGDIPWVKSTEIKFNRIKKTEESITELGLKNSSAKLCPKGSVLVAMYGQGVTRGKSAILDIDATTNQAIAIIEVGKNLNNLFLFYFLQHSYDALRNVGHGSNQSNLNLNIIKNFDIPKIKYKEQEQIAEIILSVDSKIEVNKQIKNKLIQLKKGLMNDLLSGEVRVS